MSRPEPAPGTAGGGRAREPGAARAAVDGPTGARARRLDAHRELLEACAGAGCPVCRCLRARARAHLRALLAEHVTDPEARRRLDAAWGFCAAHAAALPELPESALGTAIVYGGLVEQACAWLATAAAGGAAGRQRPWGRLFGRGGARRPRPRRPRGRCPVCAELVLSEGAYLDALVGGILAADLGAAYAGSSGLCMPHVELALVRGAGRPGAGRLAALTRERLRALGDDLRGFVAKHDHRARAAITPREAAAWVTAAELVAGRPELFGHQLERGAEA